MAELSYQDFMRLNKEGYDKLREQLRQRISGQLDAGTAAVNQTEDVMKSAEAGKLGKPSTDWNYYANQGNAQSGVDSLTAMAEALAKQRYGNVMPGSFSSFDVAGLGSNPFAQQQERVAALQKKWGGLQSGLQARMVPAVQNYQAQQTAAAAADAQQKKTLEAAQRAKKMAQTFRPVTQAGSNVRF